MRTQVHTEPIVCGACCAPALLTVVESEAPDEHVGPYTWFRAPPGWWRLEGDEIFRCPKCLHVNKERVPWPEKPVLRVIAASVGSSNSRSVVTSKSSSVEQLPVTIAPSGRGSRALRAKPQKKKEGAKSEQ